MRFILLPGLKTLQTEVLQILLTSLLMVRKTPALTPKTALMHSCDFNFASVSSEQGPLYMGYRCPFASGYPMLHDVEVIGSSPGRNTACQLPEQMPPAFL